MAKLAWSLPGVLVLGVAFAPGCREPTEVTVEVWSDVPCAELRGTSITVARPGAIETAQPRTVATTCDAKSGFVGSLVVVPSGARSEDLAVRVVAGIGAPAESCAPPSYAGCIVARRALRFVPHTSLVVPIRLTRDCRDVPCDAQSTCVRAGCANATIPDPDACASPDGCTEVSLFPPGIAIDGGAGTGATTCGKEHPCVSTLKDDFADNVVGDSRWVPTFNQCMVYEQDKSVVFQPPVDALSYCWLESRDLYDLRGDALTVRVPETTADRAGVQTLLYLRSKGGELFFLKEGEGFVLGVNGMSGTTESGPRDPVADLFWHVTEDGTTVRFSTGPTDKGPWKERGSAPSTSLDVSALKVSIGAGTWKNDAAPGKARFACFNTPCP